MKTQSWVGTKGTQIWEELGKGVNMIKIQSIEFSKNKSNFKRKPNNKSWRRCWQGWNPYGAEGNAD